MGLRMLSHTYILHKQTKRRMARALVGKVGLNVLGLVPPQCSGDEPSLLSPIVEVHLALDP